MGKRVRSVSMIGGADGPTSVFLVGKSKKLKLSERIKQICYKKKRKRMEKKIVADAHTLEEVIEYIKKKYHAREISKRSYSYMEQYKDLKASLLVRYKPELLGELAKIERPKIYNEKTLKKFGDRIEQQRKKAESISDKDFPMDFHVYKIKVSKLGEMQICIDKIWDLLTCSYSGSQTDMKCLKLISRDIYMYYGVTKEDIDHRSKRYSMLVTELST